MVRGFVMAAATLLMAVTTADAGLFSRGGSCGCAAPVVVSSGCGGCDTCAPRKVKIRKVKHRGCCAPAAPSCCAPAAPVCAAPAPVCAPAPTCCAPAPTCCAPAPAACNTCAPVATCAGGAAAAAPATAPAPVPPQDAGALAEPPKPQAVDTPAPPK
jgi:hypothetical protein